MAKNLNHKDWIKQQIDKLRDDLMKEIHSAYTVSNFKFRNLSPRSLMDKAPAF